MTQTPPEVSVVYGNDDDYPIDLCNNGIIRVRLDRTYRLRPPKIGEARELTTALQDALDQLEEDARRATIHAADLERRRADVLGGETVVADEESLASLTDIKREESKRRLEMAQAREDLLLGWMARTFALLSLDGVPDLAAAAEPWLATSGVARRMLAHWMAVPFPSSPSASPPTGSRAARFSR